MSVSIQAEVFDPVALYRDLISRQPSAALTCFTGFVRDYSDGHAVHALELEHYHEMALRQLANIGQSATEKFHLHQWQVVHRFGVLSINEPIVWVGVTADRRADSFNGCQFIMDILKTDVPFWKKEHSKNSSHWVKISDLDIRRRESWVSEEGPV